jgi:hypothetical protein
MLPSSVHEVWPVGCTITDENGSGAWVDRYTHPVNPILVLFLQ